MLFLSTAILVLLIGSTGCTRETSDFLEAPVHLRVGYAENPIGIDLAAPRLSWQLESRARDQQQAAFQVLVADTREELEKDNGNVWDSGKVTSDQSTLVAYEGDALESSLRYWWKVRVWDGDGRPTGFSNPGWWEMGLLHPEDWTASWISAPPVHHWASFAAKIGAMENSDPPELTTRSPQLRQIFSVEKEVESARLYISGLGYYEAMLNGERIGDHVLDPAFTRYDRRVLYETYDVTSSVQQGENAIGVMLGGGWFDMPTRAVWGYDHAPWRAPPVLRCQLELRYADGSAQRINSNGDWQTAPGPITFNSVRQGETYDARLEHDGWTAPGFDDADWVRATPTSGPAGLLSAQMLPPIRVTQTIQPVSMTEPRPGRYVFDLGQNIAGWARIRVSGSAGTQVTMRYAERINADGSIDQEGIGAHLRADPTSTDVYILKGQGEEVWEPRFAYHGFQYVEISGLESPPAEGMIEGRVVHTDFESAGTFTSSNDLLNKIQKAGLWAYRGNFHGYPTDCPHREKNGWTGDAHLAAEMGLLNFASASAYHKWIQDIADEQRESGELPGIVPTAGWGYHWGNGPAWDSAFLLIPSYVYQYRGDPGLLRDHYDQHKRYVDYLERASDNLIIPFGLGDWVPSNTETPAEVTSTAYFYKDVSVVAETARLIGNEQDAAHYEQLAEGIKTAFNQKYFDPSTGSYANGSQTALATALYQGLVPDAEVKRTAALLAGKVLDNGNRLDAGILGTKYLLHALTDNGYANLAYAVATQTAYPSWGHWIEQGATTLWEKWQGTDSRNHIMFGDISAWFYQTLAGIRPDTPGYKSFVVDPFIPDDLEHVSATHQSLYGAITSSWKKEGARFLLNVTVPPNTSAAVYLPSSSVDAVQEGGVPINEVAAIRGVGLSAGKVIVEVGSGTYSFVVEG